MNAPRWTLNAQAILALVLLIAFSFSSHPVLLAPLYSPSRSSSSSFAARRSPATLLPAGTGIPLALVRPLLAATAAPGTRVYARTAFPVLSQGRVAIPPGTYVEGQIVRIARSRWLAPHAWFLMDFTKMIFAGGYVVAFPSPWLPSSDRVFAAVATPYAQVSSSSDVLLDNGAQFEMILQTPLGLDARRVADAVRLSKPFSVAGLKSASQCTPIPATPGTPDTVIPGTPGTPGTSDTVISGGPGQPDIVIPGTPSTPGTPPTVIPGTPGTPQVPCPGPPIVLPEGKFQSFTQSFRTAAPVRISGKLLPAGNYEAEWGGPGPNVTVEIAREGALAAIAKARLVFLVSAQKSVSLKTRKNPDGSASLLALYPAGKQMALIFEN